MAAATYLPSLALGLITREDVCRVHAWETQTHLELADCGADKHAPYTPTCIPPPPPSPPPLTSHLHHRPFIIIGLPSLKDMLRWTWEFMGFTTPVVPILAKVRAKCPIILLV